MSAGWKEFIRRLLPRRVRPYQILAGPLKGLILVTSAHDYPAAIFGRTEAPLIYWLERNVKPGEVWLDVGAHYGYTALALDRFVGVNGSVYAFEPVLQTATYMLQTKERNHLDRLTVIPVALTDDAVLTPLNAAVVRGMADHGRSTLHNETIYGVALDTLAPLLWAADTHVDGVKIDVQGMEIRAVRGMQRILEKHKPKLVIELHAGVSRMELTDLLQGIGYSKLARDLDDSSPSNELKDDCSYVFDPSGNP